MDGKVGEHPMKKLLLAVALCAFGQPVGASVVKFCGPKPPGKCDIAEPAQHHFPMLKENANLIKILPVPPTSVFADEPFYYGFKEMEFTMSSVDGFEIVVAGRVKKEKPKDDGFYQYSVVSNQPMTEVDLFDEKPSDPTRIFGTISAYAIGGITPLATPEPPTWVMSLIGFGAFLLPGAFRRRRERVSHQTP
jgi:hypothetical protein